MIETYNNKTVFWHGSCSGDLRGGRTGLHLGTYLAAKMALEARIGIPADGKGWNGNRTYGKTLLAGHWTLEKNKWNITGFNWDVPADDFYITEFPITNKIWNNLTYPNGEHVSLDCKPNIQPFIIIGKMTNKAYCPHNDWMANGYMRNQLKKGTAKSGYYYRNESEDYGSISVVVPNEKHLMKIICN